MEMYHERPRGDETYAFLVWGVQMLCLYIEGKFADNSLVYWCAGVIAPGLAILISLKHDHSLKELGLYPNHLKRDSAVMLCAFAAELLIGVYIYGMSLEYALPAIAYYIVWIAVREEILFRGVYTKPPFFASRQPKTHLLHGRRPVHGITYSLSNADQDMGCAVYRTAWYNLRHTSRSMLDCQKERQHVPPLGDSRSPRLPTGDIRGGHGSRRPPWLYVTTHRQRCDNTDLLDGRRSRLHSF